jgi:SAM-dependent methyltransferase
MGIDLSCAQLLIRAKANGASFERMAMLGRQELHASRSDLLSILRRNNYQPDSECQRKLLDPTTVYAEDFLALLGAKEIIAIDASDYEGAQVVHDMNQPIPGHLKSSFDLFLDGGTLEHVFDFPAASRNCMRTVRPGGRFISFTMANNFCGHGFYQFSPELFFRLLSGENGYTMESCIQWEGVHGSKFYQVPDPASLGTRIELTSRSGTFLFVQARRVGDISVEYTPRQSDYLEQWKTSQAGQSTCASDLTGPSKNGFRAFLKKSNALRSGVLAAREWARSKSLLRRWMIQAEYRRRLLHRNSREYLRPLEEIRVRL